jgi:hypothetical protein
LDEDVKLIKKMFAAGAVIDGVALVPMLWPWAAKVFWGFEDPDGKYRYAMRMGAALMAGWTSLLVWAWRNPAERRFVAVLTVQVVLGIAAAEVAAVEAGAVKPAKMVPSWIMQACLVPLFVLAYVRAGRAPSREVA